MNISIVVAIAKNNAIGKNNDLPWHLPADMKFFKEKTTGHCILTGRKNYESIPQKFRPLPNRTNIVVTRNTSYNAPGAHVVPSVEEGIALAKSMNETELFIIGGGQIFMEVMVKNLVSTLYVTHVDTIPEGADVFFPAFNPHKWRKINSEIYPKDAKNEYDFEIATYKKQ